MGILANIRASSVSEFADCPARFEAKVLMGMRMPASGVMHVGTALHAGTAAFDRAKLEGNAISADDAAGVLVDTLHHPKEEVEWEDDSPSKIEPIALKLHSRYCAEIAPKRDYAGVEVTCESLDVGTEFGTIRFTGTTDRVRKVKDGFGISDLKTGKQAVAADGSVKVAGHAAQLGVYELLAEHAMGLPITSPAEIVGMATVREARVGTGSIAEPRTVLTGDSDRPGLIEHIAAAIKAGTFYGNPRSMTCHPKYCPIYARCHWRR